VLDKVEIRLGTQGWNYGSWVGEFYPIGTKPAGMLEVYARAFSTVEVDSTAYAIPADPIVRNWRARVPEGFVFSLKVPQEITHERRLKDSQTLLRRFLDRVEQLEDRLGPILVQLAPGFRTTDANRTALREFLGTLPTGFRWAVEFRDPGWMTPATYELLKSRNVSLVLVDGRWLRLEVMADLALEPTADFAYVRWLGKDRRLADFSRPQLDRDEDFKAWSQIFATLQTRVTSIYGYFNNYYEGHAPHSVREMQQLVGQEAVSPDSLREQGELF
jgi:uncharacterized protein YecE (DUF72 family)